MKMMVEFSKTVRVVVEADDVMSAARTALSRDDVKPAFDAAQTLFSVEQAREDMPLGVVVEPRVEEMFG